MTVGQSSDPDARPVPHSTARHRTLLMSLAAHQKVTDKQKEKKGSRDVADCQFAANFVEWTVS